MFLGGNGDDYAVGLADYWDSSGLRVDGGAYYADGGAETTRSWGRWAQTRHWEEMGMIFSAERTAQPAEWSLADENFSWNPSSQPAVIFRLAPTTILMEGR